jgi:pentatricopeptide repeat protein
MKGRKDLIQQILDGLRGECSRDEAEELYDSMQLNGIIIHDASGPRLPDDIDLIWEYDEVFRGRGTR